MRNPVKRKKRKHWSTKRHWKEYLKQMKVKIELNGQSTIDNALAAELMNRTGELLSLDKEQKRKAINRFGKKLSSGRLAAINELIAGGLKLNVCGEYRIWLITKDPAYNEEHNRRLARQLDQKKFGTARKVHTITPELRKEFGLPSNVELGRTRRRLQIGDGQVDVTVKKV